MARRRRRHRTDGGRSPVAALKAGTLVHWLWGGLIVALVVLAYLLSAATPDDPDAVPESVPTYRHLLVWPLVTVAAFLVLALVARPVRRWLGHRRPSPDRAVASEMPYRRRTALLSAGERVLYRALQQAVGDDVTVFAKVRLSDLVDVPLDASQWRRWHARITQKHVDFVLCAGPEVTPFLILEVDDRSRPAPDRVARDAFVEAALARAGWPVERIKGETAYDLPDLAARVHRHRMAVDPAAAEVPKGMLT